MIDVQWAKCDVLYTQQQASRSLAVPHSRASYAGPFNVGHVTTTTSGGDVHDDVISIKSAAVRTPRRSAKTRDIEVHTSALALVLHTSELLAHLVTLLLCLFF